MNEATLKWIEVLDKTEKKQGKHLLYNEEDESFCCLGIAACDVLGYDVFAIPRDGAAGDLLSYDAADALGLSYDDQVFLALLNDGNLSHLPFDLKEDGWYGEVWVEPHTFKEIASILKEWG